MPKSRKKRNEQKDFQKVKFKVGKKLKKADNVTNASFQTRTIQVTQKIKTAKPTEPSTKRKLNITELLSQFQHYSTSTRHEAVTGLKELFSNLPEIVVPNLVTVIERTAQLFVDKDPVVRQSVIKLLKVIFTAVTEKQIAAFFQMIGAHLCCAMTHIYEDMQADSLQLFDLLLDHFPRLVVGNSSQILPNFIEQISRCRFDSKSGTSALSVNPNHRMASHKWRAKVLSRLHKLLSAMLGDNESGLNMDVSCYTTHTFVWKKEEETHVQSWPKHFTHRWKQPGFILRSKVSSQKTPSVSLSDEAGLRKFIQLIMPLLIECWIESNTLSAFHKKGSDSFVTSDSLPLRTSVVNVVQLLCHYVVQKYHNVMEWMTKLYFTDLRTHLLKSFPYSVHIPAKKREKTDTKPLQDMVCNLNIAVCDIMTQFQADPSDGEKEVEVWETTVIQYLEDVISSGCNDKQILKVLINILDRLIRQNSTLNLDSVLEVMIEKYKESHPLSTDKKLLFNFFSGIILDREQQRKLGADIVDKFMTSLPDLFMLVGKSSQQMASQILHVMKKAACQNCWILLQQLNKFICRAIARKDNTLIGLDLQTQKSILELVFYVPHLPKSTLKNLVNLLRNSDFPIQSCLYLLQVIHHRYTVNEQTCERTADYVSFMLSVLLVDGKANIVTKHGTEIDIDAEVLTGSLQWERILYLTEVVSSHLIQHGDTEQMIQIISMFLNKLQDIKNCWTESQLISLMVLSNQMEFYKYPITDSFTTSLVPQFWTFCQKVTDTQTTLSAVSLNKINTTCNMVLEKLVDALCRMTNGLRLLIEILQNDLNDKKENTPELKKVCRSGTLWIQYYDSWKQRSKDYVDMLEITNTVTRIQESCVELKEYQWWTDFSFLVSRLRI